MGQKESWICKNTIVTLSHFFVSQSKLTPSKSSSLKSLTKVAESWAALTVRYLSDVPKINKVLACVDLRWICENRIQKCWVSTSLWDWNTRSWSDHLILICKYLTAQKVFDMNRLIVPFEYSSNIRFLTQQGLQNLKTCILKVTQSLILFNKSANLSWMLWKNNEDEGIYARAKTNLNHLKFGSDNLFHPLSAPLWGGAPATDHLIYLKILIKI